MSGVLRSVGTQAIAVLVMGAVSLAASQTPPADDVVLRDRLASYVALRTELARVAHLPLPPTDAHTAAAWRQWIGTALRTRRADLTEGNIFNGGVGRMMRGVIGESFETSSVAGWIAGRADEEAEVARARVHGTFPPGAGHDVHPALLRLLPPLPRGIQYRVVHLDLLLWDLDADYVIDVLPGAFAIDTI